VPPSPLKNVGERVARDVAKNAERLRVVAEYVDHARSELPEVRPVESLGREEMVLEEQREELVGTPAGDPAAGCHGIQVPFGGRPVEPAEEGDVSRCQAGDDHTTGLTADAELDAVGPAPQWTEVRLEPRAGCHRRDLLG